MARDDDVKRSGSRGLRSERWRGRDRDVKGGAQPAGEVGKAAGGPRSRTVEVHSFQGCKAAKPGLLLHCAWLELALQQLERNLFSHW